jgi:hypothetical protein
MKVRPLQEVNEPSNTNTSFEQALIIAVPNRRLWRCALKASRNKTNAKIFQALIKHGWKKWIKGFSQ